MAENDGLTDIEFEDSGDTQINPMEGMVKNFVSQIMTFAKRPYNPNAANAGKQLKKKMESEMSAKDEQIKELTGKVNEFTEKLKEFEDKEKGEKVNALVNMQEEKGMVTKENKEEVIKNFSSFSLGQLDSMIDTTKKLTPAKIKSFKAKEAGDESTKKINDLKTRITDFENCDIDTTDLKKELEGLQGDGK